tara:strand:- start:145 stop:456 length:312 start_codon:yes stop_codon:yes gene_type:complete
MKMGLHLLYNMEFTGEIKVIEGMIISLSDPKLKILIAMSKAEVPLITPNEYLTFKNLEILFSNLSRNFPDDEIQPVSIHLDKILFSSIPIFGSCKFIILSYRT